MKNGLNENKTIKLYEINGDEKYIGVYGDLITAIEEADKKIEIDRFKITQGSKILFGVRFTLSEQGVFWRLNRKRDMPRGRDFRFAALWNKNGKK
jgi:hypothetical protein